ncbi:hypothetical protein CSB37_01840 [bacterium DOLZORAL124_38_8]|nr:MAG: hypothetical protein CSB37_01840 [bacterium DOLZORAL124_38_8]
MMQEYSTELIFRQPVSSDMVIFRFTKPQNWTFEVGQFISLKFGERSFRAYSIASLPEENFIELVVRLVAGGLASEVFRTAKIGQKFVFRGAFGQFQLSENLAFPLVFCATGSGIAPLRAMIRSEARKPNPRPMYLLYGGRTLSDLAYWEEFVKFSNLTIYLGLSQASETEVEVLAFQPEVQVHRGRITHFVRPEMFGNDAEYYICGNGDMVTRVREQLLAQFVKETHIHQERFN